MMFNYFFKNLYHRLSYLTCQVLLFPLEFASSGLNSYPHDQVKVNAAKRSPEAKNKLTQAERMEFLSAHNRWRSKVNPEATDMRKMYWSSEIESVAQTWANRCKWGHGHPDIKDNMYEELGQNLYGGDFNATLVVNEWGNEVGHYDYGSDGCSKVCGHYTQTNKQTNLQVVWAKSYILGCGAAYCQSMGYGHYVVCNYYPPGNYRGEKPYRSGAPCSKCPTDASKCSDKLCGGRPCIGVEMRCKVTDHETCLCDTARFTGGQEPLARSVWLVLICLFLAWQRWKSYEPLAFY